MDSSSLTSKYNNFRLCIVVNKTFDNIVRSREYPWSYGGTDLQDGGVHIIEGMVPLTKKMCFTISG